MTPRPGAPPASAAPPSPAGSPPPARPSRAAPGLSAGAPPQPAGRAGAPAGAGPGRQTLPPSPTARRLPFRVRLLPIAIFVAVLLLGVRLGDLWQSVVSGKPVEGVSATQAQNAQPKPPVRVAESKPETPPATPPSSPTSGEADPARPLVLGSKERVGPAEIEVLQQLAERRNDLERRSKDLDKREALLVAAEQRFDQKVVELKKLREEIQGLLKQVDEKQAAQLDSLVKIYETMKPKEAARIFETMDLPVLLNVLERMKESKTAPILAAMDPLKAKEVTVALVDRRQLPAAAQ